MWPIKFMWLSALCTYKLWWRFMVVQWWNLKKSKESEYFANAFFCQWPLLQLAYQERDISSPTNNKTQGPCRKRECGNKYQLWDVLLTNHNEARVCFQFGSALFLLTWKGIYQFFFSIFFRLFAKATLWGLFLYCPCDRLLWPWKHFSVYALASQHQASPPEPVNYSTVQHAYCSTLLKVS